MLAGEQIIASVAALLEAAPGMTGRVFTDHAWAFGDSSLPAWHVTSEDEDEDITPGTVSFPSREMHDLPVMCRGFVRSVDDMQTERAALAKDALSVLFASRDTVRLAPLNCQMTLTRISRASDSEGEAAIGRITLALRVRFYAFNNDPETIH